MIEHSFRPNKIRLLTGLMMMFSSLSAMANPSGANVVIGSATIQSQGSLLSVTTATNRSIIDWQTFSIAPGETTRFIQPSATSSVLNRVLANEPSSLLGTLQSNGKVFLINPYGILVGAGANIDVAGFVASTLNIGNDDFLNDRFSFMATPNAGVIRNDGSIATPEGGSVYLIGAQVENNGVITTPQGEVILAAGETVTLVDTGTPGVSVQITGLDTSATNLGQIIADTGVVGMAGAMVRNAGTLSASSVVSEGGRVFLRATADVALDAGSLAAANGVSGGVVEVESGGTTLVSGNIEANGSQGRGGSVHVLGQLVGVLDQSEIHADGSAGGGVVLVGGDYQGKNPDIRNAARTYVGADVAVSANARESGDGGKVIVWGNDATWVYGSLAVRGGVQSGNGGFIETSGHYLDVDGVGIDLTSLHGAAGLWLLDPTNIHIVPDSSTSFSTTPSSGQLFQDTSANLDSQITVSTLRSALLSGNVTITTVNSNPSATANGDIYFETAFDFNGIGFKTLTLQAENDINISSDIFDSVAGGDVLNLNLVPDSDGASGGSIFIFDAMIDLEGGLLDASGKKVFISETTVEIASDFKAGTLDIGGGGTGLTLRGTSEVGTLLIDDALDNFGTFTLTGSATLSSGGDISNHGTFTLSGSSFIQFEDAFTTFINESGGGILNFNTSSAFALQTASGQQNGILDNAGIVNVNSSTSWEAAFSNGAAATLNIAAGKFLSLQNGETIQGDIDLAAGSTLWISELHGADTFFDGTSITGPGTLQVIGVSFSPVAYFSNVSASNATLKIGSQGTTSIDGNTEFGKLEMDGGSLTGAADLTLNTALSHTGGTLGGSGKIILASGSVSALGGLTVGRDVLNQGTLSLTGTTLSGLLTSSGTVTVAGTVNVASGVVLNAGGVLKGAGTIQGDVSNVAGTVSPGNSPGLLTIVGNYTQGPSGTMLIELAGTGAGQYDQLDVSGTVSLAGTLQVALFGGYTPTVGNFYDLVIVGQSGLTGQFTNLVFPAGYIFTPDYFIQTSPFLYGDMHLGVSQAPSSALPGALAGQTIVGTRASGGPFAGVNYPAAGGIAGTTRDPVIIGEIGDLFVPVDSPFAEGAFGEGGYFGEDGGYDSDFPLANGILFPLLLDKDGDTDEQEPPRFRRPFGACTAGGRV